MASKRTKKQPASHERVCISMMLAGKEPPEPRTADEERADVLAYLRHYISCWPPFNDGGLALRNLQRELEASKHDGWAEREKRIAAKAIKK